MNRLFLMFLFLSIGAADSQASDIILSNKAATTLNPVRIYKDSTFDYPTGQQVKGGFLFEVINQTVNEYEDNSQNQKFKWFQVRNTQGIEGWIYGDGLAVMVKDDQVSPALKRFQKQKYSFDNGFENAMTWIATIEGRDNFHQQDYLNPPYQEKYIVITNAEGRSVHLNIGGVNARGKFDVTAAQLQDVTGDGISEVVIQMSSHSVGKSIENRNVDIYSFQAGNLKKIFTDRMTLTYNEDIPSPALFKHLEIAGKTIRVAYPDYVSCLDYQPNLAHQAINVQMERCIEYVTYTLHWDDRSKQYKKLYEETRAPMMGISKQVGLSLLEKPTFVARRLRTISPTDQLRVIKHHEKRVKTGRNAQVITYLLIQLDSGEQGYVPADKINFIQTEHADLLINYYNRPPVDKTKWTTTEYFVTIRTPRDTSMSHK